MMKVTKKKFIKVYLIQKKFLLNKINIFGLDNKALGVSIYKPLLQNFYIGHGFQRYFPIEFFLKKKLGLALFKHCG